MSKDRHPEHAFVENSCGVHLVSHAEYTLCGDALEGDPLNGIEECRETERRVVTCVACIEIIEYCRGVKTRRT